MQRIYLAISDRKDLELIQIKIKKKYTDSDLIVLQNSKQVLDILDAPFDYLIVDSSFIEDTSSLNPDSIKGFIWYINTENVDTVWSKVKNVEVFPSVQGFLMSLKLNIEPLVNFEVKENKSNHSSTETSTNSTNKENEEGNESNIKETESKSTKNEEKVPPKENSPSPTKLERNSLNNNDSEIIKSSLVKTEDYPEIDEKVIKKFQIDVDHMDVKEAAKLLIKETTFIEVRKKLMAKPAHDILCEVDPKYAKVFSRKQIVDKHYFSRNKTIAVWSPISKVGVSTFLMNLAIFMGKLHIPTTVIEGITKQPTMKRELQRFCHTPDNWVSYIPFFEKDDIYQNKATNTFWIYNNVHWYPLGDQHDFEMFQRESLEYYMKGISDTSFIFVDLPTGSMEQHTLDTLSFIDELWIVSDGVDRNILEYKTDIHRLLNLYNLSSHMVFTKHFPFKKERKLAKRMEIPILSIIKDLSAEVDKNANHNHPLVEKEYGLKHLQKPFNDIVCSLTGVDYMDSKIQSLYNKFRFLLQGNLD